MPQFSEVVRYGLPGFALAFAALPLYLLTPALYAEQLGMSLALVGFILMLTRLTDAIADPFIGRWIDKSPQGLWRWMSAGVIVMAISLSLLVNPPTEWLTSFASPTLATLTWMGLAALCVSLANSTAMLAHQSWAVAWVAQAKPQARLIAGRETWSLIGVIVAAVIAGQRSGPVMAAVVLIAACLAVAFTLSLKKYGANRRSLTVHALPQWRTLFESSYFNQLLAAFSVNAIANAIPATLVLFFLQDFLGASENQSSTLLAAYFLAAAASVAFWSWASTRIGAVLVWQIAMAIALAAFIWTLTLERGDIAAFTMICIITGFALGAELVCPPALVGQIIDRNQHRGQLESSYFGVWNLVIKLALAAAAGLALPALSAMGFAPGQAAEHSNVSALQWAYAGLPCLLKLFAIIALGKLRFMDHMERTAT